MKAFPLVLGLVAFHLSPALSPAYAGPGLATEAKPEAGAIAPLLEIEAKAFDFAFDEPVYCRLTFSIRAPGNPFPITRSAATDQASTWRLNRPRESLTGVRPKVFAR